VLQSKSLINTSSFFFPLLVRLGNYILNHQVFTFAIFSPLVTLYWVLWK